MNRFTVVLVTLASSAVLCLGGCNKTKEKESASGDKTATAASSAAVSGGACDRREKEKLCGAYFGKMAKADWVKGQCEAMGVPYVTECPKEDAVGSCVRDAGTAQETQTVYYAPMTMATVTAMCAGGEIREP